MGTVWKLRELNADGNRDSETETEIETGMEMGRDREGHGKREIQLRDTDR